MSAVLPAFIARPATFDDLGAIAGLLQRIFGVQHSVETLRWKLMGSAGRLIGSTVLTTGDRIVGFLGQIPLRVRIMGREVLAAQGTDVGILEEYRRLDAFLHMVQASVLEMRAAGVVLTYGTANAAMGPMATQLFGLKKLAAVPLLVRPLSPTNASLGWGVRMLARVLSACDRLSDREPADLRGGLRLSRVARFDERFDSFWREICDDYPVMLVRDAAHLNWRYVEAPDVMYERLCITSADGRIGGYVVLGLRRRNGQLRGCIADLVTAKNGDCRITNRLIRAAIARLRAQKADVAEIWAFPHTHLRRALVYRGFIPRRRTGPGGFQVSASAAATDVKPLIAEQAGHWFLSMGDSDTV